MEADLIQLLAAYLGAMAYAVLIRLRLRLVPWAGLGGCLCWGCYLVSVAYFGGVFLPCLLAATLAELYSELLARLLRAPSTLFCIPGVIPLVPGSALFNTMSAVVRNDWPAARSYGATTGVSALAIAIGISLVWALLFMIREGRRHFQHAPR